MLRRPLGAVPLMEVERGVGRLRIGLVPTVLQNAANAEVCMDNAVLVAIRTLLNDAGVAYRCVQHAPTYTSEESAAARGEPLAIGGKALVVKVGDAFRLFVLSAARKFDSSAVRKVFGERKSRFATRAELPEMTGLVPGCVPPFGAPILPLPLYADESVMANDRIAFNAGSLTDSIILATADYVRIARPTILAFTTEP